MGILEWGALLWLILLLSVVSPSHKKHVRARVYPVRNAQERFAQQDVLNRSMTMLFEKGVIHQSYSPPEEQPEPPKDVQIARELQNIIKNEQDKLREEYRIWRENCERVNKRYRENMLAAQQRQASQTGKVVTLVS